MTKLGIFSWFSYPMPIEERLRMIKQAGFDATSLWWGDEDRHSQPEIARRVGLDIDNIHTPFNHPDDLWIDGLGGEEYLYTLVSCVDNCARHGIPVAVIHMDDNFEDKDTHLLPYDGTVDWDSVKQKLKSCNDIKYLTLEVDFNPDHEKSQIYKDLSANDFLDLAYERAIRLR